VKSRAFNCGSLSYLARNEEGGGGGPLCDGRAAWRVISSTSLRGGRSPRCCVDAQRKGKEGGRYSVRHPAAGHLSLSNKNGRLLTLYLYMFREREREKEGLGEDPPLPR